MGKAKGDVWPGMAERIAQRLRELGYVKKGNPDWLRFVRESGQGQNNVYRWRAGAGITRELAQDLARSLGVSLGWLLFGDVIAKLAPAPANGHARNGGPRVVSGGAAARPDGTVKRAPTAPRAPARRATTRRGRPADKRAQAALCQVRCWFRRAA